MVEFEDLTQLKSWSSGKGGEEVLYGTADGKLGLVRITKSGPITSWELDNEKKKGGRNDKTSYLQYLLLLANLI